MYVVMGYPFLFVQNFTNFLESSSLANYFLFLFVLIYKHDVYRFDFRTKGRMNRARSRDYSFLSKDREISTRNRIVLRIFSVPLGTNTTEKRVSGNMDSDRLGNSRIRSVKQLEL